MFGFKAKKVQQEAKEISAPPAAEAEVFPDFGPSTPIELPLDGVVPDPPAEPEGEQPSAPMLDFSVIADSTGEKEEGSSSLADLFGGSEEEVESSLGAILERTPQATIEELMEDLAEIKDMLRGRLDTQ